MVWAELNFLVFSEKPKFNLSVLIIEKATIKTKVWDQMEKLWGKESDLDNFNSADNLFPGK